MADYQTTVLADSPSLYWRLGASGTTDLSGNGRNGTAAGGVTIGGATGLLTGDANTATDFDGVNDVVSHATYPANWPAPLTFEVWANRTNTTNFNVLFGVGNGGMELRGNPGASDLQFANGAENPTWTGALPAATTKHIVLVLAGGNAELYVNGVSQGAHAATIQTVYSGVDVGARSDGSLSFLGPLDEFAIYPAALSAATILAHYTLGANGPPAPVVPIPSPTVREKPPLRLHLNLTTPYGQTFRWGPDESKPANVPAGLQFGSTMPGGFESLSCTLPRKPEQNYPDLGRLSTLTAYGPGRQVAWQGRLESAPRVSGDSMAVQPGAVGWQAHLDDDTSAAWVPVDRDLGHWGEISRAFLITLLSTSWEVHNSSLAPDSTSGIPAINQVINKQDDNSRKPVCDSFYDAGSGSLIASVYYDFQQTADITSGMGAFLIGGDTADAQDVSSSDLITSSGAAVVTGTYTPATAQRYWWLEFQSTATTGWAGVSSLNVFWRRIAMWGNHGLTKRGTAPDDGLYASDIIAYALGRWCPLLTYTTGPNGSITDTGFVIPHLEFREPTTAGEMVSAANRYHLRDWAVWENPSGGKPLFYYHDRGARGKTWRARVAPAQLEEAGPGITNLFNGVVVSFSDVDGTTKTVGPTGSGADTTSTSVMDADPLNPANQLGIRRWAQLSMNGVSTAAGATEVGRRFLVEAAQYNTSGRAQLVGHVEDDRGVIYPAWRVRAGDTISFVDASLTDPRRIVRASYSDQTKTCSVDLDSPAEGLSALLERLQVVLVGVL